MKHFKCLYYCLVEPIKEFFLDTSEAQPGFEITIETNWGDWIFALFISENGNPEYGRLTIPDLEEEKILDEYLPMLQVVREHFLSILRITYYSDVTLFPFPFYNFFEDLSPYSTRLDFTKISGQKFDIKKAKRLFVGSFPHREELRLFIDGNDGRIPLQYRYLSFYKIFELQFRKQGQWDEDGLEILLGNYTYQFTNIGIVKDPLSHIHMLRDKCAHIKTGKSKESLGVTQLNHKEASSVYEILPMMSDICIDILNTRANGDFKIGRSPFNKIMPI